MLICALLIPAVSSAQVDENYINGCAGGAVYNSLTGAPCPTTGSYGTASVTATPLYKIQYDSAKKESSLVATFKVNITAGSAPITLPKGDGTFSASTHSTTNTGYVSGGATSFSLVKGAADNNAYYTIAAGTTASFSVTAKFNPQILFAGKYTATLNYINTANPTGSDGKTYIQVPPRPSNAITIVGEISPFINTVKVEGQSKQLKIEGVRLALYQNQIFIDGVQRVSLPSFHNARKQVTVNYGPFNLTPGYHSLYINNPSTGKSNNVGFVVPGTVSNATANVSNPSLALMYDANNKEAQLLATFTITVSTGSQPVKLYKNGAMTVAQSTDGRSVGFNASLDTTSPISYDGSLYTLPEKSTTVFTAKAYFTPQQMYSGSYKAWVTKLMTDTGEVPVVSIQPTNSVTIVGEATGTVCPAYTRDLTLESRGADVLALQTYLASKGFFVINQTNSGYFEATTKQAVAAWQASVGITPADGFFGPIARAFIASTCTNPPPTGSLIVSNASATFSPASNQLGSTVKGGTQFNFTLSNTSNSDVYVSRSIPTVFVTSNIGTAQASLTTFLVPTAQAGDTSTAVSIPAGATRAFTVYGAMDNTYGSIGLQTFKITGINYGSSANQPTGSTLVGGLENLRVAVSLDGGITNQPSITLLSPNGGETFKNTDIITVNYGGVNLLDEITQYLYSPTLGNVAQVTNRNGGINFGTGKGSMSFKLESNIVPGQYKMNICDNKQSPAGLPGKSLCDISDNYFTIINSTTPPPTPTTTPATSVIPQVLNYTLINADTDQPIAGYDPIPAGATLNLATLPTKRVAIRANTSPSTVGSVKFVLSGAQTRTYTENGAPYSLHGDTNSDYAPWTPVAGTYTLIATPYTKQSAAGTAGTPIPLTFRVTTGTTASADYSLAEQMANVVGALNSLFR